MIVESFLMFYISLMWNENVLNNFEKFFKTIVFFLLTLFYFNLVFNFIKINHNFEYNTYVIELFNISFVLFL